VQEHCGGKFNSREIQCLYKRFRTLDKRHKGYISEDELMSIPELAISPLAPRVTQVFQNLNFKDFCRVLAAMSDRATREDKLDFMFRVSADLLVFFGHRRRRIIFISAETDSPCTQLQIPRPTQVYDVDRDGYISFSDLETIVKHLVGSSLNEEQVGELITRAMGELGELRTKTGVGRGGDDGRSSPSLGGGITFDEFRVIMKGNAKLPTVKVPVGFD
jgi:serine/threonine-protein phosphatase 2B regulatory subunit